MPVSWRGSYTWIVVAAMDSRERESLTSATSTGAHCAYWLYIHVCAFSGRLWHILCDMSMVKSDVFVTRTTVFPSLLEKPTTRKDQRINRKPEKLMISLQLCCFQAFAAGMIMSEDDRLRTSNHAIADAYRSESRLEKVLINK
ncbi:hypothetical protein Tco_0800329 [Tanacetum coccineum]|uniref:Uncharacterized protein n=1 Tax=Tanacetum coccineum TaxID=301880 RepID=A0ABQ4ZVI3_9ASTR